MTLLPLLTLCANAHPLDKTSWSSRAVANYDGKDVAWMVLLEVPISEVQAAIAVDTQGSARRAREQIAAVEAAMIQQLDEGLAILVDGNVVPGHWTPSASPYHGKASLSGGFFLYIVEFQAKQLATTPDGSLRVQFRNRAFTDKPMVHSVQVESNGPASLVENSALSVLPGRAYDVNDTAFWSGDTSLRDVTLTWQVSPEN